MSATFSDLGVPESICTALVARGITQPFQIQAATIADALAGRDVCGRAPTGSGKTLAFGIPLVVTVARGTPGRPRALVLVPTRELAEQITAELGTIAGRVRVGCVYGGVSYAPQVTALRRGVDILVACPGRLEDLIGQQLVELSEVDRVVIDEADRMADMGFMPSVRRLLDQTATPRQTVLFSATLDGDVAQLTRDYQDEPVRHEVGEETPDVTSADHVFWRTGKANRTELTVEAVNAVWPAIIFSRTRHGSDRLARSLQQQGIATAAIHGGRSQQQRNRALADFANGRVHALVATDVAARGIHVDGVASVIHYDPPEDHKAYIHRSGRTARAGRSGVILSLVQPDQVKGLRRMQRQVGLDEPLLEPDAAALRALSGTLSAPAKPAPAPSQVRRERPAERSDRSRRNHTGERSEPSERSEGSPHPPRPGRSYSSERPGRNERPGRGERTGSRERPGRSQEVPGREAGESGRQHRPGGATGAGVKLSSRTRISRAPGGPPSAKADPTKARGRTAGAGPDGNGRADRVVGANRSSGRPDRRGQGGAKARSAAGASSPGAGRGRSKTTGSGRPTSTPNPAGNRKARRAHMQWS